VQYGAVSIICNRCGKKIADHGYTTHIIRHAFQDWDERAVL